MKWVIFEEKNINSIGLGAYTEEQSSWFDKKHIVHEFEVEAPEEREERLGEFFEWPSYVRAAAYQNAFIGYERYNPPRWDDVSDEEYELFEKEVDAGIEKYKEDFHDK